MAVFPVVLDSCVLYPMHLRDILLRLADIGLYRVHWSQEILDGATRNIVANPKTGMDERKAARFQKCVSRAFPDAMVDVPANLVEIMPNHPGDRHVMAVAVKAHAQVIVTNNLKHFLPQDLDPWEVEAQSPDTFLTHLYDLEPDRVADEVDQLTQDLKNPPFTVDELLKRWATSLPVFVSKLERHFRAARGEGE